MGQKQTYAVHKRMSALPPIATAKADSRGRSCLLYPRKRTCAPRKLMSALGQKRTHAVQRIGTLFDQLVGELLETHRHIEAQCLGGREVDDQLVLGRRLHRHVSRVFALQDAVDVAGCAPVRIN